MKVQSLVRAAILLLAASCGGPGFAQTPPTPGAIPASELHGGIEISPRTVRSVAVRISNGDEGYNVKLLFSDSTIPPGAVVLKEGRLTPEYIQGVAGTVQKLFQQLRQQYQIPEPQIHIIGLADLVAPNLNELGSEILSRTGRPTSFIDVATDTELSIAGIIPRRYSAGNKLYDNRSISMLIDLANTSIRGGYQQIKRQATGTAEYEFVTWDVPRGSSTFAAEVARAAGESATLAVFANRAQTLAATSIRPLLQSEIAKRPSMRARRKIYLTGSVIWAMMTLLHPEQNDSYLPITMNDITTFYNRAHLDPDSLMNPDLSKISDENHRNEMRRAREVIKATYSPKTLLAGAEMLRTLAMELQFENKRVLYPRFAWFARILSYVRLEGQ
ncbi:MAG: hypothetical protein SF339_06055 [Blastocatellia bacterium]|nr:hypothetical protein [Blastocatellia bacterium]